MLDVIIQLALLLLSPEDTTIIRKRARTLKAIAFQGSSLGDKQTITYLAPSSADQFELGASFA